MNHFSDSYQEKKSNQEKKQEDPSSLKAAAIELPKGGGAIKGIEEKFQVNAINGTSSFGIPIPLSPSRQNFVPALGLSYNSGNGNSAFGSGWQLGVPSIARKTEKKLPEYKDMEDSDTFVLSGSEDLVPLLEKQGDNWVRYEKTKTENGKQFTVSRYRPRIEGLFARIERWKNTASGEIFWKTITKDNMHSYFGLTTESRVADPADVTKVFEWMLCRTHDDKGNICLYNYKKEDFANIPNKANEKNRVNQCTQLYLKEVWYGNKKPYYPGDVLPVAVDFLFRVVLDYGEHDANETITKDIYLEKNNWSCRKDPFSTYRSGFEIRTYRRCNRIFMFHCFESTELPHNPYLAKSLQLFYDEEIMLSGNKQSVPGFSFLVKARQNGHLWNAASNTYKTKYLPETEISYQAHEWNTTITAVSPENIVNLPAGIDNKNYLWIDLYSEGIAGILTEQDNAWYYKSNLGHGDFSTAQVVATKPNFGGLKDGCFSLQELEGNGVKYLVQYDREPKGFFKLTAENEWEPFKSFTNLPNINLLDTNLRPIDLNGDGALDLLITDADQLSWYASAGEKGFTVPQRVSKELDEEKGPAIIFADRTQSIFLADITGDGLTDIVRIRNGEVCYWPNLGYGLFGKKVTMDHAPVFDHPDAFNPALIRLADIDGSGTTDIVYLGKNNFQVWMNLNGNEWTASPQIISAFPQIDNMVNVNVIDFLGSGTACIVCSSAITQQPIAYIDLMNSKKPHIFTGFHNNCGKEVSIEYRSSTFFYLEDKKNGNPWITKLPFPVYCIYKVRTEDKISDTVFTTSYQYRHGYFDAEEREFRGFARVEQLDTEDFSRFKLNASKNVVEEALHQPPVKTISWFHTGAFLKNKKIIHQCEHEYFKNIFFNEYVFPEPVIARELNADELREAHRAFNGSPLRMELYAMDGSDKETFPYSATQSIFEVRMVQPKLENRYASFQVLPAESITYNYERDPADPRISQSYAVKLDELGNPIQHASVVYPRVKRPVGSLAIPDKVWEGQSVFHLVYGETVYTNDIIEDDIFRLRAGCESRSYEISGAVQPLDFFFTKKQITEYIDLINADPSKEILFEEEFTTGLQKRLASRGKVYFMKDDFSGPLPFGQLSPLGIGHSANQLAFTKNLVSKYYGTKVSNQLLIDAKYVHSEGDEHWWTQTGTTIFAADPKANFYTPLCERDVFGNTNSLTYDGYTLLITSATDAIGNTATSLNDYRTLSPVMVTDPNLNRAAVESDELGFIIKSAVMGKAGKNEGDTLTDPTSRKEYDLFNWKNNKKPNYVHTFDRERHGASNTRWQESYVYSDGGGNVVMVKAQTKAGLAKKWNPATKIVEEVMTTTRWLANGRTIINNKGKTVKQYEPYFSATFEYEDEAALVETGITTIQFYDPVGRSIRTEFPNGTFTKSEFDSWQFKAYDTNDTVKESRWYIDRGSPDPLVIAEPVDPEQRAAWLAAKHSNTPSTVFINTLGRTNFGITDFGNGKTTSAYSESDLTGRYARAYDQLGRKILESNSNLLGTAMYGKTAEKGEQWVFADVMGRLVKMWDNDIREIRTTFDKLHRPVSNFVKENGSEVLFGYTAYGDLFPDAADRNMKGAVYQLYDQSGVVSVKNVDFKGNATLAERRLAKEYKQLVDWKVLESLTSVAAIEAAAESLLEKEIFASSSETDALGRPITITLPDQSVFKPVYNEANVLDALQVKIKGSSTFTTFLESQDHDAKGQRQFAKYGNGAITRYFYDATTFRLTNLLTKAETDTDAQSLQNIFYTFDPAGNIVAIKDDAQQTHYFNNAVVKPESKFEYDASYQLLKASGREHAGLGGNEQRNNNDLPFIAQLPHTNDSTAVRNYSENYQYDDCGNILLMQHAATNANWKQNYRYAYQDDALNVTNRLKATNLPGDADTVFSAPYTHDLHGNMTSMPHLSAANSLKWNFSDQLKEVNLGGGGTAYYAYGVGGSRIRKIIERIGGKKTERIYLGGVEIYRERQNSDAIELERYTLHIADNGGRIAQVDLKTIDINNSDPFNLLNEPVIRYQFNNHLGSAVLETDENGIVISYEEYHPFGTSAYRSSKSTADLSLKRYRFNGKERDEETGFYCFGTRYYAAWLGRWTSSDPGGFKGGFNLYKYCSNNPVMYHDPNGMDDVTVPVPKGAPAEVSKAIRTDTDAARQTINNYLSGKVINGQEYIPGSVHWDSGRGQNWAQFRAVGSATSSDNVSQDTVGGTSKKDEAPGDNPLPAVISGIQETAKPTAGGSTQVARAKVNEPRTFTQGEPLDGPYNLWSNEKGGGLKDAAKAPGYIMEDTVLEDVAEATAKRLGYTGRYDPNLIYGSNDFKQVWGPASESLAIRAGLSQTTVTSSGLEPTRVPPHPNPAGTVQMELEIPRIQLAGGLMAQLGKISGIITIIQSSQVKNPYVKGIGIAAGSLEFVAGNSYLIGVSTLGSGYVATSTTSALMTFGRVGGRIGGGVGMIALSGYALYTDVQNGNYGTTPTDTAGMVAGGAVLAGSTPVLIGAMGVVGANLAGDYIESKVTPAYGRTAGVAAGTAAGAGIGAAVGAGIGVWFFGAGALPGALIGGAIGGIAGFIGSFW
jgi:RHS repeat-associated protein